MIPFLIANVDAAAASSWNVVTTIAALAALGANLFLIAQRASGKGNERQIEPTELHAISTELKEQTVTLNKLDREMGETKSSIEGVDTQLTEQRAEIANAFKRINAISQESAALKGRFEDHLAQHREDRRHA